MLADGQSKNVGLLRQSKAIDSDIVRNNLLLLEHKLLEFTRVEHLPRTGGLCGILYGRRSSRDGIL